MIKNIAFVSIPKDTLKNCINVLPMAKYVNAKSYYVFIYETAFLY